MLTSCTIAAQDADPPAVSPMLWRARAVRTCSSASRAARRDRRTNGDHVRRPASQLVVQGHEQGPSSDERPGAPRHRGVAADVEPCGPGRFGGWHCSGEHGHSDRVDAPKSPAWQLAVSAGQGPHLVDSVAERTLSNALNGTISSKAARESVSARWRNTSRPHQAGTKARGRSTRRN